MTDSENFEFAYLNPFRKLFLSDNYAWSFKKADVVKWVDKILADSIQASPHTSPVKKANTTICAYQTCVKGEYQFGRAMDDFEFAEDEDGRPYQIIRRDGYLVARWDEDATDAESEDSKV
jgi:hypothetical protein